MDKALAIIKVTGVQDPTLKDLDYEINCDGYFININKDRVKVMATRRYFDINGNHLPNLDQDASYYLTDPDTLSAYNALLEPILRQPTIDRLKENAGIPIE